MSLPATTRQPGSELQGEARTSHTGVLPPAAGSRFAAENETRQPLQIWMG